MKLLFWLSLALILGPGADPVWAHSWYPWECCSATDCAPIEPTTVRETPNGYVVTVAPGSHPMWGAERQAPLTVQIPYGRAKASPDGKWHLCINAQGGLLCFYAILGGS
jgi:hypothetical protein